MDSTDWLNLDEAAEYLGMGKTLLYTLSRENRIPSKKVGKKWMFEKSALDAWIRGTQSFESFFLNLDANVEGDNSLREPQREGYARIYEFFRAGNNNAIIQIPVGCGKTGLASILPLGLAAGRVLVVAPNLTIKDELFDAMDITNRQKCFWRKTGVLRPEQMVAGPLACTLDSGNITVAKKCHIVITNIHQLATNEDKWLTQFPDNFFDMIIVDEAHHSAAKSWEKAIERFPTAKVIFLTATPFRSDRKELKGELAYRFSFRSATLKGYIKRLKASYVAPSVVILSFHDQAGASYSLEEVLKLKEEDWFSRGVALSAPCNKNIVDSSLAKLEELRQSGTQHQLIAVACSINHAKEIRSLYGERGYNAEVMHSKLTPDEQETILRDLRSGALDCIVQVQMLGEGFDHPKLSVAAIFRPFRSLAPYIQFVGRIMRVVVQNDPTHPDNVGHIVTHLGMNLNERLKEFKEFENDDQAFWNRVIGGEEPEVPAAVRDGKARLRAAERVVVYDEIVDSLWEEDFTDPEDQQIIDDLRERMTLLGLDPSHVEEMVMKAKRSSIRKHAAAEPFPVLPQRQWEEAKRRLNEQGRRLANILLNHVELQPTGVEIPFKYKTLRLAGRNNFICALMMVNKLMQDELGKTRKDASTEEFKELLDNLDERILQPLVRRLRKAKSEYEQTQEQTEA
jgi:excisionase family DNA binding protein